MPKVTAVFRCDECGNEHRFASLPEGLLHRSYDSGETWQLVTRALPYVNGISIT